MRPLRVISFGRHLVDYGPALRLQEQLAEARKAGAQDTLLLLQHAPVYTLGKRGSTSDFKVPVEEVKRRGNAIYHAPRGGEVTYHGPGQLVAYPIVGLRDLGLGARAWVEGLEDTLIATLGSYGVHARGRVPGATGVWVDDRKIAALGVKISHGVSSHGLALNVNTDLSAYDLIVPCGIRDKQVTSLKQELDTGKHEPGPAGSEGSGNSAGSHGSGGLGGSGGADSRANSAREAQPSLNSTMNNGDSHGSHASSRCHANRGSCIRSSGHAHAWAARGLQPISPGPCAVVGLCMGLSGSAGLPETMPLRTGHARTAWPGLAGLPGSGLAGLPGSGLAGLPGSGLAWALGSEHGISGWSHHQTPAHASLGQGGWGSKGIPWCDGMADVRADCIATCDCIARCSSMGTPSRTGPAVVQVAGMQAQSFPYPSTKCQNHLKPSPLGLHCLRPGSSLRPHTPRHLTGINTSLLYLSTGTAVPGIPPAFPGSSSVLPGDPDQAMEQVMEVFLEHFCRQFGFACDGMRRLVPGQDSLLDL